MQNIWKIWLDSPLIDNKFTASLGQLFRLYFVCAYSIRLSIQHFDAVFPPMYQLLTFYRSAGFLLKILDSESPDGFNQSFHRYISFWLHICELFPMLFCLEFQLAGSSNNDHLFWLLALGFSHKLCTVWFTNKKIQKTKRLDRGLTQNVVRCISHLRKSHRKAS